MQGFEILAGSVGRIEEVRIRSGILLAKRFELELRVEFIALGGPKRPKCPRETTGYF